MASPNMSLKLLIDNSGKRVLFAEASKEFVDFLFHIFSLPLGTLIEFLGSENMVGCLGKLKESIDTFNQIYLQPGVNKDDIVNPKTAFNGNTFLLSYDAHNTDESDESRSIYRCSKAENGCYNCNRNACLSNVTLYSGAICPNCNGSMSYVMNSIIKPKENATVGVKARATKERKGYVQPVMTYMVMDDLVVKPMSTISGITLINKFGVKEFSQLEEKIVSFGKDEGLKLLKASLATNNVLTSMFVDMDSVDLLVNV